MAAVHEEQQLSAQLAELAQKASAGSESAFNELYRLTRDRAYFVAFSITKNEDDALDILQDSYLKAWSKLDTLENYAAAGAWLNQIVGNTAKNFVKKQRPQLFQPVNEDNDPLEWQSEKDSSYVPDEAMDTGETRRLIMEIVDSLPEDQRLCVLMHYYNDLDLHEIAASLELPYETVRSRLRYARRKISDGVEDLERKGTKLYGAAPIPLVVWFLKHALAESSSKLPPAILVGTATKTGSGAAALALPKIIAAVSAAIIVAGGVTAAIRIHPAPKEDAATTVSENETAGHAALPVAAGESFAFSFPTLPVFSGRGESSPNTRQGNSAAPVFYDTTRAAAVSPAAPGQTTPSTPTKPSTAVKTTATSTVYTGKSTTTTTTTTVTTKTTTTTTTTTTTSTAVPYVNIIYNYAYNGGSSATKTSASVLKGAVVDLTPMAQRPGWTFIGWNTDLNAHAGLTFLTAGGHTTLYAIFDRQVTATFHDYAYAGGDPYAYTAFSYGGDSLYRTQYNNDPVTVAAPALRAITGWTPLGWSASRSAAAAPNIAAAAGQALSIAGDAEYYGVYRRDAAITFNADGGAPVPDLPATFWYISNPSVRNNVYTPDITMPVAPMKVGASFRHWLGDKGDTCDAGVSVRPLSTAYTAQWD